MAREITEGVAKLIKRFLNITNRGAKGTALWSSEVDRTMSGLAQLHGEDILSQAIDVLESHWINNRAWWDGKPIEPMTLLAESCYRKEREVG